MTVRIPNYQKKEVKAKTRRIIFADLNHPLTSKIDKQYQIKSFEEFPLDNFEEVFFYHAVILVEAKNIFSEHSKQKIFWKENLQKAPENIKLIVVQSNDEKPFDPNYFDNNIFYMRLPSIVSASTLNDSLANAFHSLSMGSEILNLDLQQAFIFQDFQRLVSVGKALLNTKNFDELLTLILQETTKLVSCDGGSIYVIEQDENGKPVLRFKKSLLDLSAKERLLPIDNNSIAGYVIKSKQSLSIDDVYNIPKDAPYKIDKSFDKRFGYHTRSMLIIPMENHAGNIIGAIQLINRKQNYSMKLTLEQMQKGEGVLSFDERTFELASAMAGLAAVAIENNRLVNEIQQLFEGFVKASVTAIEQRDPSTKGHSERVAILTVELAKSVNENNSIFYGVDFNKQQLREIRYASLLHDFGKVGVREKILTKAKKLYPEELDLLKFRFRYIRKLLENEMQKKKIDFLKNNGRENFSIFEKQCDEEFITQLEELQKMEKAILKSNETSYLEKENDDLIRTLSMKKISDGNRQLHFLDDHEFLSLSIKKGSLTEAERKEIESHVSLTYDFLKQISWTSDLKNVPDIAHGHHEKLDGSGYPLGLKGEEISIQARMMAIADIFDAFTASDRYYKKAVPIAETLNFLHDEAKHNHLDKDLLKIFTQEKIYEKVLNI